MRDYFQKTQEIHVGFAQLLLLNTTHTENYLIRILLLQIIRTHFI